MARDSMPDDSAPDASKPEDANAPGSPVPAPVGPPSFPVTKLVVSAAGIALATWIWLGSGWRWEVTPRDLAEGRPPVALGSWAGRYVRLVGARDSGPPSVEDPESGSVFHGYVDGEGGTVLVKRAADAPAPEGPISGRAVSLSAGDAPASMVVDTTRGRWDSRAVLAIVVILWGLAHGVANVYLWRRRRELASREA